METKYLLAGIGISLVFVYAIGSGVWVSNAPGWYSSLVRPPWQPPDYVFGIIWPYNFVMLGIAAFNVAQSLNRTQSITWLIFFAASVAAALTWAYQFYVPHNLSIAAIALVIAALLTIPVLYLTFKASLLIGALLLPYQIWVIIASTLAWGYSTRN
ncbi:MAG: tryptophan-rich sensory protein [Candidatus Nanopelagicaceae bacterium]|nr:tryptophan-rich sensory protein [Candidatus Nanopelagicaceae bacterium]